jgi:amino acid adenylation domain-containing protein
LAEETVKQLKQLSREENTTLFATMLALYKTLLHRQSQQEDVIVGTTVALCGQAEFENLFGYLVNALPIRTQPEGKKGFRSFLAEVRESMRGALLHQEYPFQRLVERLQPERDASRTPIFQTMFTWDKARPVKQAARPVKQAARPVKQAARPVKQAARPVKQAARPVKQADSQDALNRPLMMEQTGAAFDLTFCVFEVAGELTVGLKYNTDLFDTETIERMADQFNTMLADVLADPNRRLEELSLMSDEQRERILIGFNRRDVGYSDALLFHELFEQHVSMVPDAPAMRASDQGWTYSELNKQANQLAHYLGAHGVGPGKMVGLFMPRSAQAVVSILAVWKCGAAYLPLAADYPLQRLQHMVDDARPDVILLDGAVLDDVPRCDGVVISLPQIGELLLEQSTENLANETTADDAAYVIYTSGSTGNLKGVLLRHRGLCNLVEAQKRTYNVGPGDRILQFSSLSFDASVVEMLLALTSGGELVMPTERTLAGGAGLEEQLREDQITIVTLPLSALAMIPSGNLPWLRTIVSAGEACTPDIVQKWGVGRRYFNAYGPTECTVWTTLAQLQPGEPIHIGRPIANVKAYILDSAMQPTPIGVPGELYLGGPGVAPGYLNRPELTAERFVSDPFSDDVFARLYRTGDLARYTPDGNIDFLGRVDRQLKIRGRRIELGEVESVLSTHPAVNHAAVKVIGSGQTARLVAYLVYQTDAEAPNVDQLREHLSDRLTANMLPSYWVVLDHLPLTPNGKVDRDALPDPDMERPELASQFIPANNDLQRRLVEVWQNVLQIDRVGIEDNFFALGGASIQALEVAECAAQVGLTLDPQLLFQFQTIAELSSHVVDGAPESAKPSEETEPKASTLPGDEPTPEDTTPEGTVEFNGHDRATSKQALADETPEDDAPRMRIESLGVYLPERVVTTDEVLAGCDQPLEFPMEQMTGIKSRRVVADDEFSFDLARKSVQDCLAQSAYSADEIDLLICCNISRCDGPDSRFTFEPSTASRLRHELGMHGALAFDISNACAGFFTALTVVDTMLAEGAARRAMVVSGEHITHLTRTAQKEIEGFMDPRLASLTLGDSGAATILERSHTGGGFQDLSLFTMGAHHQLCVAKLTANGATMHTDALGAASVAIRPSIEHALNTLWNRGWSSGDMDHIILHQTSQTALDSAMQEFNRTSEETVCTPENTVANLAERGNTATTTHMVALHDQIKKGEIRPGDGVVFGVSGSGQTLGTGLYIMDELATPGSRPTVEKVDESAPSMALARRVVCASSAKAMRRQRPGAIRWRCFAKLASDAWTNTRPTATTLVWFCMPACIVLSSCASRH